jgi:hypothetical protein
MKRLNWRITKMAPKLIANHRYLTRIANHQTRTVHASSIPYGSYNEDTTALTLAFVGLALMTAATLSVLVAFAVL